MTTFHPFPVCTEFLPTEDGEPRVFINRENGTALWLFFPSTRCAEVRRGIVPYAPTGNVEPTWLVEAVCSPQGLSDFLAEAPKGTVPHEASSFVASCLVNVNVRLPTFEEFLVLERGTSGRIWDSDPYCRIVFNNEMPDWLLDFMETSLDQPSGSDAGGSHRTRESDITPGRHTIIGGAITHKARPGNACELPMTGDLSLDNLPLFHEAFPDAESIPELLLGEALLPGETSADMDFDFFSCQSPPAPSPSSSPAESTLLLELAPTPEDTSHASRSPDPSVCSNNATPLGSPGYASCLFSCTAALGSGTAPPGWKHTPKDGFCNTVSKCTKGGGKVPRGIKKDRKGNSNKRAGSGRKCNKVVKV